MFYILLIINTFLYGVYCYISYIDKFKQSVWFTPFALGLVIIGNLLWIYYLKNLATSDTDILIYGLIWDVFITLSFIIIPFVFFKIELTYLSKIGLFFCLIGIGLLKVGELINKY